MLEEPAINQTVPPSLIEEPPTRLWDILGKLGPGLIIAGSVVGSGELIGTTKTGAQSGISLLWLILIGCLIKVFVQVELGRYTVSEGVPTLEALNSVPGPRWRVNWLIWYWVLMMAASVGQLGGIVGGVGQAMAISLPITGDYARMVSLPAESDIKRFVKWENDLAGSKTEWSKLSALSQARIQRGQEITRAELAAAGEEGATRLADVTAGRKIVEPTTTDDRLWAIAFGFGTSALLWIGRYSLIQHISTFLVVGFTFVTVSNVVGLQLTEQWSISAAEIWRGLSFSLPDPEDGVSPLTTAFATFGIIGVGATELIAYPYWCLEKGYAQATGPKEQSDAWANRAAGWIRVMMCDALASMVIYTVATIAFFLMGVAVLYSEGRDPDSVRMVSTLATAYVPIFGPSARWIFLFGAIAVLYSTYLIACAGHARTIVDATRLFRGVKRAGAKSDERWLLVVSVLLPLLCLMMFLTGANPVTLILVSGISQALMLPMLAGAALYFRYTKTDPRLRPSAIWDVFLALSSIGMLVGGIWGVYSKFAGK